MRSDELKSRYEKYLEIAYRNNVLFQKYEDMISDPESFESRFSEFIGLPVIKGEIVKPDDFRLEKENPYAHKRYVQAGDHRNKLKPETIAFLNNEFSHVLERLGYEKSI